MEESYYYLDDYEDFLKVLNGLMNPPYDTINALDKAQGISDDYTEIVDEIYDVIKSGNVPSDEYTMKTDCFINKIVINPTMETFAGDKFSILDDTKPLFDETGKLVNIKLRINVAWIVRENEQNLKSAIRNELMHMFRFYLLVDPASGIETAEIPDSIMYPKVETLFEFVKSLDNFNQETFEKYLQDMPFTYEIKTLKSYAEKEGNDVLLRNKVIYNIMLMEREFYLQLGSVTTFKPVFEIDHKFYTNPTVL